jgi:NitT/TauT family transport system substrate-binding protein
MAIVLYENFRALFYAPFYAAEAIGAYRDAGVDVAIHTSPDPATTGAALRSGAADVMWGGPLRVLMMAERDPEAEFVCVCNVVERDPFFVIGRTPRPDFTLADLAGLRLASVSEVPTPWLCLQDDLRRIGVDPDRLDRRIGASMAENAQALRAGEVDAVQLFQPYAEALLREGVGHVWYAAATRGLTAYTTLVTRRAVLRERPAELRAMIKALAVTLDWFSATPAGSIARTVRGYFPDMDPAVLGACIERYKTLKLWATSPVLAPEGFERLQDAMLSGGALRARIGFDICVDNTLAEAVNTERRPG